MGKNSFLVWNNGKPQRAILHDPGCALPEASINQGQEGLTKFYSMFAELFKELYQVHTCPAVATSHQREGWTHQTCCAMVTDTKDRDFDDKDNLMPPLIYPEDSDYKEDDPCEYLSYQPSSDPT